MSEHKIIRIAQVMGKMNYGGVEAVVMNYYRHIDRTKVQFDFIVDEDSKLPQKEEIERLGGRIQIVPRYENLLAYVKAIYTLCKKEQYTIIHAHMNVLSVFPLAMAKLAKVPVRIAHSHSTQGKGEWKRNLVKTALKPFSKWFATHYFACSALAGKWLFGKKAMETGKVTLISNAIAIDQFCYQPVLREQKRKELGVENAFVIGHIGRFMPQKNHTFLIDIFAHIYEKRKDAVLLLVGDGQLETTIQEKVKALGMEKACMFLGNRKDVAQLYQAMDVFLLPSLYEGLPVVGIEAQTAGVKTFLSSAMTQETKLLESTEFLSLEQGAEAWANAILQAKTIDKYTTAEQVRKKGYAIQTEAKKMETMYQELEREYAT